MYRSILRDTPVLLEKWNPGTEKKKKREKAFGAGAKTNSYHVAAEYSPSSGNFILQAEPRMPGVQNTAQWRPVCSHGNRETVAFLSAFLQETSCCQQYLKFPLESKAVHIPSSDTRQKSRMAQGSHQDPSMEPVAHCLAWPSPIPVLTQMEHLPCWGLSSGI